MSSPTYNKTQNAMHDIKNEQWGYDKEGEHNTAL
jgi:hypothetical protein